MKRSEIVDEVAPEAKKQRPQDPLFTVHLPDFFSVPTHVRVPFNAFEAPEVDRLLAGDAAMRSRLAALLDTMFVYIIDDKSGVDTDDVIEIYRADVEQVNVAAVSSPTNGAMYAMRTRFYSVMARRYAILKQKDERKFRLLISEHFAEHVPLDSRVLVPYRAFPEEMVRQLSTETPGPALQSLFLSHWVRKYIHSLEMDVDCAEPVSKVVVVNVHWYYENTDSEFPVRLFLATLSPESLVALEAADKAYAEMMSHPPVIKLLGEEEEEEDEDDGPTQKTTGPYQGWDSECVQINVVGGVDDCHTYMVTPNTVSGRPDVWDSLVNQDISRLWNKEARVGISENLRKFIYDLIATGEKDCIGNAKKAESLFQQELRVCVRAVHWVFI